MSPSQEKAHNNDVTNSKSNNSGSRKRGHLPSSIDEPNEKDSLSPVGRQHKKMKITIADETPCATISADSGKIGEVKDKYKVEDDEYPLTSFLQANEERNFPPPTRSLPPFCCSYP